MKYYINLLRFICWLRGHKPGAIDMEWDGGYWDFDFTRPAAIYTYDCPHCKQVWTHIGATFSKRDK